MKYHKPSLTFDAQADLIIARGLQADREIDTRPLLPESKHDPNWHLPIPIPVDRIFGVLSVLSYLLQRVAPQSAWKQRVKALLATYPDVPLHFMGFPAECEESPIWMERDKQG